MATKKPVPGLIGFKTLSNKVFLYEPPKLEEANGHVSQKSATANRTTSPPSTIMVFGWADGQPRHVAKYTEGYKRLYPSARIVAVLSQTMSIFLTTASETQESMRPVILSLPSPKAATGPTDDKVLIHILSNGGGINLEAACKLYRSLFNTTLPHAVLIYDSTPGGDKFWSELIRWSRATTSGAAPLLPFLPRWFVQGLAIIFCTLMLGIPSFFGKENVASRCRRTFNDPTLLSHTAKRLYLYSEADDMIGWKEIEQHAAESREKGWSVRLVKFKDSPHVSHLRMHPEQYWDAVTSTWDEAMGGTKKSDAIVV